MRESVSGSVVCRVSECRMGNIRVEEGGMTMMMQARQDWERTRAGQSRDGAAHAHLRNARDGIRDGF